MLSPSHSVSANPEVLHPATLPMTQPFSVRIFLADGDPAGVKVVEKSNWTGVGLVFAQPLFAEPHKRGRN